MYTQYEQIPGINKTGFGYLLIPLLLVMTLSVKAEEQIEKVLVFGVYESERASEMYRLHQPMIEALEASLTRQLQMPIRLQFRITRNYRDLIDQLGRGELDMARVGPATMILAQREAPDIHLLAAEQNRVQNDSLIIVAKSSGIDRLQALRGQRFAFGSSLSTEGRYLAQAHLLDAGIAAQDISFDYLGRHDKVLKSVELMDYTAGAIKSCVYEKNNGDQTLRILARIPSYSKVWLVSNKVDSALAETIREALLAIDASDALDRLEISNFTLVNRDHYQDLEIAMEKASHFGGK